MQQISEELKNKIAQFQAMQQQLQMIAVQKQQLAMDKRDAEEALEQLKAAKGDVFKSVGPILMRSDKASLEGELSESMSSSDSRTRLLESQEKKVAVKAQELQKELQASLS